METATRRSRWEEPDGTVKLVPSDLAILKLLVAGTEAREPWGYTYLPTSYFADLLGRGREGIQKRITELRKLPRYIALAEQPRDIYRDLIYKLGRGAVSELDEEGITAKLTKRAVAHELLACMTAASFELASLTREKPIHIAHPSHLSIHPDWPIFTFCGRTVFIEADMGTETNKPTRGPDATSSNIGNKFRRYLQLIASREVKNPFFAFITCKPHRIEGWDETLRRVIDADGYDQDYAEHFGFMPVKYDRFLSSIPKLSTWAATEAYVRPGFEPFRFIQPERS